MAFISKVLRLLNGTFQEVPTADYLLQAMPLDIIAANLSIPANRQYAINGKLTINNGITVTVATNGKLVIS